MITNNQMRKTVKHITMKPHKKIANMQPHNNKVPDRGMMKKKIPGIRETKLLQKSSRSATNQSESRRIRTELPNMARSCQLSGRRSIC